MPCVGAWVGKGIVGYRLGKSMRQKKRSPSGHRGPAQRVLGRTRWRQARQGIWLAKAKGRKAHAEEQALHPWGTAAPVQDAPGTRTPSCGHRAPCHPLASALQVTAHGPQTEVVPLRGSSQGCAEAPLSDHEKVLCPSFSMLLALFPKGGMGGEGSRGALWEAVGGGAIR